jgi:hypothetical protein
MADPWRPEYWFLNLEEQGNVTLRETAKNTTIAPPRWANLYLKQLVTTKVYG